MKTNTPSSAEVKFNAKNEVDVERNLYNNNNVHGQLNESNKELSPDKTASTTFYQTTEFGEFIVDAQPKKSDQSPKSLLDTTPTTETSSTPIGSSRHIVIKSTSPTDDDHKHNHHHNQHHSQQNINNNNRHQRQPQDQGNQAFSANHNATQPPKSTPARASTTKRLAAAFRQRSVSFRVSCALVGCAFVVFVLTTITLLWYFMGWQYGVEAIVVAVVSVACVSGIWHWFGNWLYIAAVTVKRDATGVFRYIRLLSLVRLHQWNQATLGEIFEGRVEKHPTKACFVFEDRIWTFKDVNDFANQVAHHFQLNGFKNGDVVGLYMENRPEFVATWLGLSKIGITIPLINTNLRQSALLHSIQVASCNALIYGESCESAVKELKDELPKSLVLYQFNNSTANKVEEPVKDLARLMHICTTENIIPKDTSNRHHKKVLYIYTSGTTGLPKAAVITHSRYIFIAAGIHYIGNLRNDDIFYTPLPLYHTAGGVMSIGQALLFGSTVVIRKKFSASAYFADCTKNHCTVAQYIGEMCRYVLATKHSPYDTTHSIRTIFGNGLRPQIWPQFVERFGIRNVAEFYGATEGNANIVNIDNTVGAIGFVSRIIPSVYPISIIRANPDTGEPIRGPDGLCQLCEPNEPGVFIGKILPGNPSRAFLGYVDKSASSKKIVKDVFAKGDQAFISGDVLVADERGYLFFKDRTGDTFRWKGENVSTSEVEAQISNVAGLRDCVVYGVQVGNLEGRAGMAAISVVDSPIDLVQLAIGFSKELPSYARPQFIRLLNKVEKTGTFKLKKLELQQEGFDPTKMDDEIHYLTSTGSYERLTTEIYKQIESGAIRL